MGQDEDTVILNFDKAWCTWKEDADSDAQPGSQQAMTLRKPDDRWLVCPPPPPEVMGRAHNVLQGLAWAQPSAASDTETIVTLEYFIQALKRN